MVKVLRFGGLCSRVHLCTIVSMTDKHARIDEDNYEALSEVSKETDVPIVRLVNKAIREWLKKRQSEVKNERK